LFNEAWLAMNSVERIPTVVFIDSRSLTRDSIARWLQPSLVHFRIVAVADLDAAIEQSRSNRPIALVLLNIGSASVQRAAVAEQLAELVIQLGDTPLAVLAENDSREAAMTALRLGVRGYLPTSLKSSAAVEAVRLICAGELYAPLTTLLSGRQLDGDRPTTEREPIGLLPPRQAEIVACLRKGMANKEIAVELGVSEGTVKVHIRRIMKKLKVANRTQIVVRTEQLFERV
jgi:DNA-binding NarL/FixJ family response regulator